MTRLIATVTAACLFAASLNAQAQPQQALNAAVRYWTAFALLQDPPANEGATALLVRVAEGTAPWDEAQLGPILDANAQAELEVTRDRVETILRDLAVLQGERQVFLLREPAVLTHLRIPAEQRSRLQELIRQLDKQRAEEFRGFHQWTPDQRRQRSVELARKNEGKIAELLSPEQLRRLRQVALQCQGPRAFRDACSTRCWWSGL